MTDYSILVLFFLLLPILVQIVFPLLMLIIYGFVRVVNMMFFPQEITNIQEKVGQELQFSRS